MTALFLILLTLHAQSQPDTQLVGLLKRGGYVLVMRHASSPREAPDKSVAQPDNVKLERQLDEAGRRAATSMGDAVRALGIPITTVQSSPTYRALETVKFARLGSPESVTELGDNAQSMQGVTEAQAVWLRTRVAQAPRAGNVLFVTHQPNLARAFPDWGPTVAEGETVVLHPDGKGGFTVAGRIPIAAWTSLR